MQMRHALATIRTVVDHEPKAFVGRIDAQFLGDFLRRQKQMTKNGLIVRLRFADTRNEALGDDENVGWRLRIDVVERDAVVVLVNDVRRDFARDDFFENGHCPKLTCRRLPRQPTAFE